jgi:hypothetical protein
MNPPSASKDVRFRDNSAILPGTGGKEPKPRNINWNSRVRSPPRAPRSERSQLRPRAEAVSYGLHLLPRWALQCLRQWQDERNTELTSTDKEAVSVSGPACLVPNLQNPAQQSESFVNTKHGAQQSDEQGLALWHRRGLL